MPSATGIGILISALALTLVPQPGTSAQAAERTAKPGQSPVWQEPFERWGGPLYRAKTFEELERMVTPLLFTKDRAAFLKLIRSFAPSAAPRIQWKNGILFVSDGTESIELKPTNFEFARFELNRQVYQWVPWELLEDQIAILRRPPYVPQINGSPRPYSEKILGAALGAFLYVLRQQSDSQGRKIELAVDTRQGKRLEWTCDRVRGEITDLLRAGKPVPETKLVEAEKLQERAVRNAQLYCDDSDNRATACQQARDLLNCATEALRLKRKARALREE